MSHPTTLSALMQTLRDPQHGCPWDLQQDHARLARYLQEEAAEVLDALAGLEPGDPASERHLREELGDLWLQVCFHAQLASERRAWDIHDVERDVVAKLVRRHPHVFGDVQVADAGNVLENWAEIKRSEKAEQGRTEPPRVLEGLPAHLSALAEALEIGRRCARVGFDWQRLEDVLDKVREELDELQAESDHERVEAEFGDVLFSLVQWARHKGIDPDRALRRQMVRFKQRFRCVEDEALRQGGWERQSLETLEAAWQAAKARVVEP